MQQLCIRRCSDNYAMRGSTGTIYEKYGSKPFLMTKHILRQINRALKNNKLCVLHFVH